MKTIRGLSLAVVSLVIVQGSAPAFALQLGSEVGAPEQAVPLSPEFQVSYDDTFLEGAWDPQVVYNWVRDEYLVVWQNSYAVDWSGGDPYQRPNDISARRVGSSGELGNGISVVTGYQTDEKHRAYPAAAYNALRDEYLFVYVYNPDGLHTEVWGRRVAANFYSAGPEFLIFQWSNRAFRYPKVAWNPERDEYLVVAHAVDTLTNLDNDVAGRRVMGDGTTPYAGHNISLQDQTHQPEFADVVYNPAVDEYLVVWRRQFGGDDWDIYGARVRAEDDQVVTPPGEYPISWADVDQGPPAAALINDGRYMVLWSQLSSEGSSWDLRAKLLAPDGTPPESSFPVIGTNDWEFAPALATDRITGDFFAAWWNVADSNEEIWGIKESLYSGIFSYFQIADNAGWGAPSVALGSKGYLTVYTKPLPTGFHVAGKIYWRRLLFLPLVQQ